MGAFAKIAAAGVLALSLGALAAPASADTLGSFAQIGTGTNIHWVQSATPGTGGKLFSGGPSATSAAYDLTSFSFNTPDLQALQNLGAKFLLTGAAASGNAATGSGLGQTQTGITGSFSLTYDPTHTSAAEKALVNADCFGCTNLLTVSFVNAVIQGGGATAHFTGFDDVLDDPAHPMSVVFTSDFIDGPISAGVFDLTMVASKGFTIKHTAGKALTSFNAASTGNFSGAFVPEPASWALMIMGFGGVGVMLRNRRGVAATTA